MATSLTIARVALGLPRANKDLVAFSKNVLAALTNNAHFPSPDPTLAVFSTDITAFDQTETTSFKDPSETAQRNTTKLKVVQDLHHLADYVQSIAETAGDDSVAVITSSGFNVRKRAVVDKPAFAAKDGPTSGSVRLAAKAVAHVATYYWEYSLDAKTWTRAPDTLKAGVTISGLTPGQLYSFRFRALTRTQAGDFSQIITHIVR